MIKDDIRFVSLKKNFYCGHNVKQRIAAPWMVVKTAIKASRSLRLIYFAAVRYLM